jgi:hypothetical protein
MAKRRPTTEITRCPWAKGGDYIEYHDAEWGVPVHDDRLLFEFLILEGAQAGLSWATILKKRGNYRKAFDGFDSALVAKYGKKKQASLMSDAGIVRNRLKIESASPGEYPCNQRGSFRCCHDKACARLVRSQRPRAFTSLRLPQTNSEPQR